MAGARSRNLTEKGVSFYEQMFDGHQRQVQRMKFEIEKYFDTENLVSLSPEKLQEFKDSLVLSMTNYENSVTSFTEFLARNRSDSSDRESSSLKLIFSSIQGRYKSVLFEVDSLMTATPVQVKSKPQEASSVKTKVSRRSSTKLSRHIRSIRSSSSLFVLSAKQRAEMEARKVKLKATVREAAIIQKQAALQADLAILSAQRDLEEAEVKHKVFMEELEYSDGMSELSNDLEGEASIRTTQYIEDQNERLADTLSAFVSSPALQEEDNTVPQTSEELPLKTGPSNLEPVLIDSSSVHQTVTSAIQQPAPVATQEINTSPRHNTVESGISDKMFWCTPDQPIMSQSRMTGPAGINRHYSVLYPQLPEEALPASVVPTPVTSFSSGMFRAPTLAVNPDCTPCVSSNNLPRRVNPPFPFVTQPMDTCTTSVKGKTPVQATPRTGVGTIENLQTSGSTPVTSTSSEAQAFTTFLLKKELLFSRLTKFRDTPESYIVWKSSFQSIMNELAVSPMEEMDLLVKWLGPDSSRQASSLRTSNPMNPTRGVRLIWERLDQRYGSPEVIEDALKRKLSSFATLTKGDTSRYYDLLDILSEVDANMQNAAFKNLLSYYNSSSGIIPIVNKLPQGIQEKWTTRAHKYKQDHKVPYPPFTYFIEFVSDITCMKNDPGFLYEQSPANVKSKQHLLAREVRPPPKRLTTQKTEVSNTEEKQPSCPLHHTRHKLNKCRVFRKLSIVDRKKILRKNSICFRCCEQEKHSFKDCNSTVRCEICKGSHHPTALHIDIQPEEASIAQGGEQHGGEQFGEKFSSITSLCSQICRDMLGMSKSCAKTVLVKVYPTDHPDRALKLYAIIDDQSNQSLARTAFFDYFGSHGNYVEYSMSSCSGVVSTAGRKATGFTIEANDGSVRLSLPSLLECNQIPDARHEIPVPEAALFHSHLHALADSIPPLDPNADILLLIGRDLPAAHHVEDQRVGPLDGPIGQKLKLGWVIIGEVCLGQAHQPHVTTNKTHILANGRPSLLLPCTNCFEVKQDEPTSEFPIFARTSQDDKPGLSLEDKEFLQVMETSLTKDSNGNWEAPLPFKSDRSRLPNNRSQVVRRALSLDAGLRKDAQKHSHMMEFMGKILTNGHAEVAPKLQDGEECWYLPLFGVYHPKKPGKIRGVFDSSANCNGLSLNSVLLSGPNIVNSLLGILLRFRKDSVAVTADIDQMFYCFKVAERHRNFLRFLWYRDNCLQNPLIEYRMTTYVFGNSPSPAIAMYGLRKAVESASDDVRDFVIRNFYVDDGLISTTNDEITVSLVSRTQKTLIENGNIRLHKLASNSKNVLKALNQDDLAIDIKDLDLQSESPPVQRSLGLYWNLSGDYFTFSTNSDKKPCTKRGVLATTNSLFDPLGFAAPVILKGRLLFRDLVISALDWDEPLSEEHRIEWELWCESLCQLSSCHIPRQYISGTIFGDGDNDVHIFSDASKDAISAVAYLKRRIAEDQYQVSFLLGKVKLAPQHGHTIPRLELCAAVLATEIGHTISDQLDIPPSKMHYYSDSKIVLGYLWNRVRRFYVYVSNRVDRILCFSSPSQWSYVSTEKNPADKGTRCIQASDLHKSMWLQGPSFLRNDLPEDQELQDIYPLIEPDNDSEIKPVVNTMKTSTCPQILRSGNFENFSTWKSLIRGVAKLTSMINAWKKKDFVNILRPVTSKDLSKAQLFVLKEVQQAMYAKEIKCLQESKTLPRDSSILNISPYLDSDGLLRVGGRLNRSGYNVSERNPIILSRKHHVSMLLVRHYHAEVRHQGRHFTEGAIRKAGFWITGVKRLVSSVLQKCVQCRKLRRKFSFQQMSDLPSDRLKPCPPFTSVGVDIFGPWNVVSRRTRGGLSHSKRWAVLFTCLVSRAVHIEVIDEMSTSTFINALRRFYSIRGPVKEFRSDRGTNFVGCTSELGIHAINIEDSDISNFLRDTQTVWIFNPPHASHMGGVWERQIGTARRILDSMLLDLRGKPLTHDVLTTLMCEVSAIINSRPLVNVSTYPQEPEILSPSTLLTQKPASVWLTDFSHLDVKDMYRNQWKCVQVLAEEFWTKWKKQYITGLQQRRKWYERHPNLKEGDVVLVKDVSVARIEWPLGLVTRVFPSDDDLVRSVEVRLSKSDKSSTFVRPINELVYLMSSV